VMSRFHQRPDHSLLTDSIRFQTLKNTLTYQSEIMSTMLGMRKHYKDLTVMKKDGRSYDRKMKEAIRLMAIERIRE
jgi:hypothetical protein